MAEKAEIPVADCVRMAATNPARLMSINDRKGSIEQGKAADLILFDDRFRLHSVWIGGRPLESR